MIELSILNFGWTPPERCGLALNPLTQAVRRAQIKLGPPLFVPNSNIGTFGAISQIRSLIRSRADLFDVAFAGPAAAAAASAALFVTGLVLSSGGVPKARAATCAECALSKCSHELLGWKRHINIYGSAEYEAALLCASLWWARAMCMSSQVAAYAALQLSTRWASLPAQGQLLPVPTALLRGSPPFRKRNLVWVSPVQEQLLPVPTALFQGSLLLGSVAQAVLGPAASGAAAFVHPALIAGWAGLVGSALNSLPVGSLDGGRMIQARAASSRVHGAAFARCQLQHFIIQPASCLSLAHRHAQAACGRGVAVPGLLEISAAETRCSFWARRRRLGGARWRCRASASTSASRWACWAPRWPSPSASLSSSASATRRSTSRRARCCRSPCLTVSG